MELETELGTWNLKLKWNLELGTWNSELGTQNLERNLELGTWNSELEITCPRSIYLSVMD